MVINIIVPDGLLEDLTDEIDDLLEITGPGNTMMDHSGNSRYDYLLAWMGYVIKSIAGTEILNLRIDGEHLYNKTKPSLIIYYEDVFKYVSRLGEFPLRGCLTMACPDTVTLTNY